jgi:hypothetical protein
MTVDRTLPSGKTLTGLWGASGQGSTSATNYVTPSVTYQPHLAADIPQANRHFIGVTGTSPAACEGTAADPTAAAGHLCVYAHHQYQLDFEFIHYLPNSRIGFVIFFDAQAPESNGFGSWAVTAP